MTSSKKQDDKAKTDALELLKADHAKVKALFREFDKLKGIDDQDERKAELTDEICQELSLHTMLEEELFYPAVRSAIDNDELIDEAEVEHAGAKDLISQLEVMYPGDDHFDATIAVLGEDVQRHIDKEESIIFPAAKKSKLDMQRLGEQLSKRRAELEEDIVSPPSSIDGLDIERGHNGRRPTRPPG